MNQELLPCPFCGGDAEIRRGDYYEDNPMSRVVHSAYYYVHCNGCGASTENTDDEKEAVELWNRRVVGNCKDCKFWNLDGVPKHHAPDGWGWCNLINGLSAADNKAYAISEDIVTAPDYGCIQFEAKQ